MESAFDPRSGQWEISWPGRVARHDLVYGSPPADPLQGIPWAMATSGTTLLDGWKVAPESPTENAGCGTDASGAAMLGLPKMF